MGKPTGFLEYSREIAPELPLAIALKIGIVPFSLTGRAP